MNLEIGLDDIANLFKSEIGKIEQKIDKLLDKDENKLLTYKSILQDEYQKMNAILSDTNKTTKVKIEELDSIVRNLSSKIDGNDTLYGVNVYIIMNGRIWSNDDDTYGSNDAILYGTIFHDTFDYSYGRIITFQDKKIENEIFQELLQNNKKYEKIVYGIKVDIKKQYVSKSTYNYLVLKVYDEKVSPITKIQYDREISAHKPKVEVHPKPQPNTQPTPKPNYDKSNTQDDGDDIPF